MLPEGWREELLDSVARRGSGHTPSKDYPEYWNGGIKWVSLADSSRLDKGLVSETDKEISEIGIRKSSAVLYPPGTVVLSRDAGVGKSAVMAASMAVSQHFIAWDCSESQTLHNWYLYYWLQRMKPEFERVAIGSTIKTIGLPYFKRLRIQFPDYPKQCRIAQILSTWDQAIATAERLLANSRQQKLAMLAATLHLAPATGQSTNGEKSSSFPSSVQAGIPNLPPTPKGWKRSRLDDHLKEVRRPVKLLPGDIYELVTVKRSRGGVQRRETLLGSAIKTPSQFYVRAGDFLISKRQIVHGACGLVPPELDGAIVSNEYAVLKSDGEIDLRFLRYLSESRYFQQTCFHSSIGVHVEKMIFNTERWLSWPFNIPPLNEQAKIIKILDDASREVSVIEAQMSALKQEKSALMSQLLTGKRRVLLSETETEAAA